MVRDAISHGRLMRESTDRVEIALRSGDSHEQMVAHRLMENPTSWMAWENEHSGLMRQVADHSLRRTQAAVLKKAALRLIQRKALFDYLRIAEVRGVERHRVVAGFHPAMSYTHAIIAEHGLYLRKACSLICASHVGSDLVEDDGFQGPMQRYEALYAQYFALYCRTHFGAAADGAGSQADLLPLLKFDVEQCRKSIMESGPPPRSGPARRSEPPPRWSHSRP